MEQDGGASRRPITSGTILDELPSVIPAICVHWGADFFHGQVISWTDISVSDGPPREDDFIQPFPMPAFFWPHLRLPALHSAILRATLCIDQYVFFFIQGDHGNLERPLDASNVQSSARASLQTDEGFEVPGGNPAGMNYIGRGLRTARDGGDAPHQGSRHSHARLPATDEGVSVGRGGLLVQCADQMWYRPCCGVVSCRLCDGVHHRRGCTRAGRPVPVPPLFRTESGQRPPGAFVQLAHPEWLMFRYISGDRYVLTSFYQTEDAHYFHADRGI